MVKLGASPTRPYSQAPELHRVDSVPPVGSRPRFADRIP